MLAATATAFGVVFVAELGDKSQLLALTLAARQSPWSVVGALAAAAGALMALSVGVGGALAAALPESLIEVVAGVLFIGFGVKAAREARQPATEMAGDAPSGRSAFITATAAFAVAELGDKTMLAAAGLAATGGLLGTWAGATAGMVAASGLAIVVGRHLGRRLPERTLGFASAALFIAFGVTFLAAART